MQKNDLIKKLLGSLFFSRLGFSFIAPNKTLISVSALFSGFDHFLEMCEVMGINFKEKNKGKMVPFNVNFTHVSFKDCC